jgi:hypothetical protein
VFILIVTANASVHAACCYFSAKDKDVNQPAQKAFITWEPEKKTESFTVQPKFEGNAVDFGMVVPTPAQPKLDEMPRGFFKSLAVYTILEPMDLTKYKRRRFFSARAKSKKNGRVPKPTTVRVLESGVVGSLDYKIIVAERADDLYTWLKENQYTYSGDEKTLGYYIQKKWFFTVMKIDPKQMKKKTDGSYQGDVTPTRFTFKTDTLIYPLRITKISVKDRTEALFYIQAPHKVDLAGSNSYQMIFAPMWHNALSFAVAEKVTDQEKAWQKVVEPRLKDYRQRTYDMRKEKITPATLEWAKRIKDKDIGVLTGQVKYNRKAPAEDVKKLKQLKGHIKPGMFITKMRKIFTPSEMNKDLQFVRAKIVDTEDDIEYYSILPTSPP